MTYPRGGSWREVNVPMRAAYEPGAEPRRLVSGTIIHHQIRVLLGYIGVKSASQSRETRKLCDICGTGSAENLPRRRGCEQVRRTVTDIGVGVSISHARRHRQNRLLAIQRLDLQLLIHAEHDRSVWKVGFYLIRRSPYRPAAFRNAATFRWTRASCIAFGNHCGAFDIDSFQLRSTLTACDS